MTIDDCIIAALESAYGVEVATSDMETFKRRFYARRKVLAQDHPAAASISLRPHPQRPEELAWLVRQDIAGSTLPAPNGAP